MKGENRRYSNFELLRIISMFMIVAYHYAIKGQGVYISEMTMANKVFIEEVSMFGKIGVNIFVLITGYFGVKSRGIKIIKMLKLECQVLFFSLLMMVLGFVAKGFTVSGLKIQYFFPIISNIYWFMTAYMVLYCFMPFINKMLLSLQDYEIKMLRFLIIIIWCVIPTFTFQLDSGMNWSQQIWMFATYILGASFRLLPIEKKRRWWTIEIILSIGLLLFTVLAIELVGIEIPGISKYATYFRWSNSVLAVLVSIGLFVNFEKKKRGGYNKNINRLAAGTIGVYLFHEHPVMIDVIYKKFLLCKLVYDQSLVILVIHFFISSIMIYLVGYCLNCIYELIYSNFLERRLCAIEKKILVVFNNIK